jgi:hypothetical protein
MTKIEHACQYKSFFVSGTIVTGDYEGDTSIPRGVNILDAYVDNLSICTEDGEDYAGLEVFTERFEDKCCFALVEDWKG